MRSAKRALGALFVLFAVGTVGVSAAVAEEELNLIFQIDGMR